MKIDTDHFMILPPPSSEDKLLQCVANCKNLEFKYVMLASNYMASLEYMSEKLRPEIRCKYIIKLQSYTDVEIPITHDNIPIAGIQLQFDELKDKSDVHLIIQRFCQLAFNNSISLYVSHISPTEIEEFHKVYRKYADIIYVIRQADSESTKIINQFWNEWRYSTTPINIIMSMPDSSYINKLISPDDIDCLAFGTFSSGQEMMLDKKITELPDSYASLIGKNITMRTTRGNTNRPGW